MTKKVALVTGANRGIGLEVCKQLAEAGCKVILCSRDLEKGIAAADSLKKTDLDVTHMQMDVIDQTSIRMVRETLDAQYGRLDILVNNAGILPDNSKPGINEERSILVTPISIFEEAMRTNTFGVIQVCQGLVPLMTRNRSGSIVNVSSQVAQLSKMESGIPAYRLSKVALNAVTLILADELKEQGVICNSVSPGWVKTEMGGPFANLSISEGAKEIVRVALFPNNGPTGKFFRLGLTVEW